MKRTTKKLTVLGVSFVLFLGGVATLQLERGTMRTVLLAAVFAGLLTIAGVLTVRRMRGEK